MYVYILGFSSGSVVKKKKSACQYRRCSFNPWVRKIPWRRKWQPSPIFLPGKSHGQESLVGYSPWGGERNRHNLATKATTFHIQVRILEKHRFNKENNIYFVLHSPSPALEKTFSGHLPVFPPKTVAQSLILLKRNIWKMIVCMEDVIKCV